MNEEFERMGFKVVRGLADVTGIFEYLKENKAGCKWDSQSPLAPSWYRHEKIDQLQDQIHKKMEEETGLVLLKTYNYTRLYNKKSVLKRHTDRGACEISTTINLGYDGDYNWPICIKDKSGKEHSLELEPGDGLIYLGNTQEHWREDADERVKCHGQCFIHYVDKDGPFAHCEGDPEDSRSIG
jgi:hypothetical protein